MLPEKYEKILELLTKVHKYFTITDITELKALRTGRLVLSHLRHYQYNMLNR